MKYEFDITDYHSTVSLLSEQINMAKQQKVTFKQIHRSTGLAVSTISKLYYSETRFPRYETIVRLLCYFNFRVYARRSNVSPIRQVS